MADRTIKPDSGNDLVLQNDDGGAKIELNNDDTIDITGSIDTGTFNGTIGSSATDSATSSTSITSASVGNLDLNNCFSASYSVYEFYLGACAPALTTGIDLEMKFLISDGSVTTADIWFVVHDQYYTTSVQDTTIISENTSGVLNPVENVDSDMSRGAFIKGTIFNPFSSTDNTSGYMQGGFRTEIAGATSKWAARDIKFSQETLVSCTGLRFNWASGNWATGATNAVGKLIVKGVR